MNFVQPGGVAVATVAVPSDSYPGTDFASAFFNVNVNRSVSEQECEHFAFVDTRNADGEPVDAEKVKVGSTDMETTSNFSASAIKQAETQYYHSYMNGACYEYVLGLGTEGFATEGGIGHVNRDEVFARLEKILATVKINPVEQEHIAEPAGSIGGRKGIDCKRARKYQGHANVLRGLCVLGLPRTGQIAYNSEAARRVE